MDNPVSEALMQTVFRIVAAGEMLAQTRDSSFLSEVRHMADALDAQATTRPQAVSAGPARGPEPDRPQVGVACAPPHAPPWLAPEEAHAAPMLYVGAPNAHRSQGTTRPLADGAAAQL